MKNIGALGITLLLFISLTNAGHAGLNLPKLVKDINANADAVPPQIANLFGNERLNFYLEDGIIGIITKKAKIIEYKQTELPNPTMNIYTDTTTIRQMFGGKLTFSKALESGKLKYNAVDAVTKIKLVIAEIFGSTYSVLTGRFVDVGFGLAGFTN